MRRTPVDFETVCDRLEELGFNGVELGSFKPHPNPDDLPEKSQRAELMERMLERGLVVQRHRGQSVGREADQHRRSVEVHRRVPDATPNSRAISASHGIRVDCVQPPTIHREVDYKTAMDRVVHTWKTCCRHRRRQRPVRHLGVRARLRLQQAERYRSHSRRRRQAELRPACTTPATGRWSA